MANPQHHTDTDHHEHGTMDATGHQRVFEGFVRVSAWSIVASIAILIFMALSNA
ncbi:aa3-type cytochrome c oxidase subunit IV [Paracoccus luteus]|uniref:aa3-type cytochrome c oxidase subunit IV n=1 Tax=Paracoccus luteus TaxID=2508543 RepID=UPI00106FB01B|nr:aa3-type cytochrome c oxidase subunit IV [Paracoccus luteus]